MDAELWKSLLRPAARDKAETAYDDFTNLLLATPTPLIADAMDGQNVVHGLTPIIPDAKIAGPITTAQTDSFDWGTTVRAIENAMPGDILFIQSTSSSASVWGGLTSRAAKQRGLAGTIVCGSCRDIATIRQLHYPTWVRTITPRAGKPLNKGAINVPLVVDGTLVNPRDLVKADEDGVVIVPASSRATIAHKIATITVKELSIDEGLKAGVKFSDLLNDFP